MGLCELRQGCLPLAAPGPEVVEQGPTPGPQLPPPRWSLGPGLVFSGPDSIVFVPSQA